MIKPMTGWSLLLKAGIVISILLLNGCSHTGRKDGPPNFYVDETKIPNSVPRL